MIGDSKHKEERDNLAKEFMLAAVSMPAMRAVNEDYIGTTEKDGRILLALADGLGGHGKGDEASRIAVETSMEIFQRGGEPTRMLASMFEESQKKVMERQAEERNANAMKTTLSLVILDEGKAYYGHIGDSRIYFFSGGEYILRTLDHSVPQMLVSAGKIRENRIRGHEDRNRLLRVIGVEWDNPRYEIADPREITQNDAVLLCSDGFWELITEKQMSKTLKRSKTASDWIETMESLVLSNGKNKNMDNYSAIAALARRENVM